MTKKPQVYHKWIDIDLYEATSAQQTEIGL